LHAGTAQFDRVSQLKRFPDLVSTPCRHQCGMRRQTGAAKQPTFSFLALVKKTGSLPKSSRTIDPLSVAKQKILAAITVQEGFVCDILDEKPLPKRDGGDKTVST
jgi:hypothetical protein